MGAPDDFSARERRLYAAARRLDLRGRKAEIAALVAAFLTREQIARRLGITKSTVNTHLEEIFNRLEI
ncbi:MAG: LuxR C-terminal-related transcriptional regulator, partial [Planctomycetota bacterium]